MREDARLVDFFFLVGFGGLVRFKRRIQRDCGLFGLEDGPQIDVSKEREIFNLTGT
jgi:hypothetical protein